jgi:hypothetical protein
VSLVALELYIGLGLVGVSFGSKGGSRQNWLEVNKVKTKGSLLKTKG